MQLDRIDRFLSALPRLKKPHKRFLYITVKGTSTYAV